ncbi:hypothetical protein DICPUDRAFT_75824 [Dictyostelium purpureum]|uniref:Protein kinase domain-containing protein n=1 Tax=Dictyostelium purpureum TaxID=5786 RepID=F0ZBS1_DICPU|nr:uncharacterized protein DICPUDRAFT_75824 [Dictyostelium purpureum]EGC38584.1 hypothetical protein DICPUDRAFT_75824 [Dictyostelium purpureum]|eukprot:XP_003284863.1 hypothetical protein DICPUDRAFT_75824 [Dictyostelium purpureum]
MAKEKYLLHYNFNIKDWDFKGLIGKGGSCKVHRAFKKNRYVNGFELQEEEDCAIKIIDEKNHKIAKKEIDLIRLLFSIPHENIIKFYGYGYGKYDENKSLFIYMEYMKDYDKLSKHIANFKYIKKNIIIIIHQILLALDFLHTNNIVHRDIKCDNILYNPKNNKIKLIDFGVSKLYDSNNRDTPTIVGTPSHMAPETILGKGPLNVKVDIYSFGCTLLEMITGEATSNSKSLKIDKDFEEIINKCKRELPDQRPSAKELLDFPIFKTFYSKISILKKKEENIQDVDESKKIKIEIPDFNKSLKSLSMPSSVTSLSLPLFNEYIAPKTIPLSVTELKLASFNRPIVSGSIPTSVKNLVLPSFNQTISHNSIPSSVTQLTLEVFLPVPSFKDLYVYFNVIYIMAVLLNSINSSVTPILIPSSVKSLTLNTFNRTLSRTLVPSSVTSLSLPSFDKNIKKNTIPSSVTSLSLDSFNKQISQKSIPNSVTNLRLKSFDLQLEPHYIPSSISSITLDSFNKTISHDSIPKSVKELIFPNFNQAISDTSFPSSIQILSLSSFNHPIQPFSIPKSVTSLTLVSYNHPIIQNTIPKTVRLLSLKSYNQNIEPNVLPSSITHLILPTYNQPLQHNSIPPLVKKLILSSYNHELYSITQNDINCKEDAEMKSNFIPDFVEYLDLNSYNYPIPNSVIPDSVKELFLKSFNHPLNDKSLPSSVSKMVLGENFEYVNGDNLNATIYDFTWSLNFTKTFKKNNYLPKEATILVLDNFNQKIIKDTFPKKVHTLTLGSNFKDFETLKYLPESVKNLTFGVEKALSDEEKKNIPERILKTKININNNLKK